MNLINILPSICESMDISLVILLFNKTIHSADPEDSKISYVENILQWKIDKSAMKTYLSSCHMNDEELFHDIAALYTNSYLSEMDFEDMNVIEETKNKSVVLVKDYNDAFAAWGKDMGIGVISCNDLYKLKR